MNATATKTLTAQINEAREAGDWEKHAELWEQRRIASVEADESILKADDNYLLQACEWMEDFILACNENRVTQEQSDLYSSMMKLARDEIVKARAERDAAEEAPATSEPFSDQPDVFRRGIEGDCPTIKPYSVETLEELVVHFADLRAATAEMLAALKIVLEDFMTFHDATGQGERVLSEEAHSKLLAVIAKAEGQLSWISGDLPLDGDQEPAPLELNDVHLRLLRRGAKSKWIGLADYAGTRDGEVCALGDLERAGLVRVTQDKLPPGPPSMAPREITEAGRAALSNAESRS